MTHKEAFAVTTGEMKRQDQRNLGCILSTEADQNLNVSELAHTSPVALQTRSYSFVVTGS